MVRDAPACVDLLSGHSQAIQNLVGASLTKPLQWEKDSDVYDWQWCGGGKWCGFRGCRFLRNGRFIASGKKDQKRGPEGYKKSIHAMAYKNIIAQSATLPFLLTPDPQSCRRWFGALVFIS
jgi:hypothetical protein